MSWSWRDIKRYICDGIKIAIESGAAIAEAPLTALLAPEIGPAAPIVAWAIVWIAQHTAEGLRGYACDSSSEDAAIKALRQKFGLRFNEILNAELLRRAQAEHARHQFLALGEGAAILPLTGLNSPARPLASQVLARQVTDMNPTPLHPIVSAPSVTPFSGAPVEHAKIGIASWPRMDDARIKKYQQWDRYQDTWNGQPHATFPKVGF